QALSVPLSPSKADERRGVSLKLARNILRPSVRRRGVNRDCCFFQAQFVSIRADKGAILCGGASVSCNAGAMVVVTKRSYPGDAALDLRGIMEVTVRFHDPHGRTVMQTTVASFGEVHFGQAALGHRRRTKCLVRIADQIYRHPGGTLPAKLHEPKDYKAMDRLVNRPEVTHAAVLQTHCQRTLEQMRQAPGVILVLHDTTELDYSGLHSITDLGPIGG